MGALLVGCAGWHYADWAGVVYPPHVEASQWLAHYAGLFPLVEIDSTFYRIPEPSTVAGWVQRVEDVTPFSFAAKLNQEATHEHLPAGRLDAAQAVVVKFLDVVVAPLERAGRFEAVLLQLPPTFARVGRAGAHDPLDALCELVKALEPERRRVAIEFRHASWFHHREAVTDAIDALAGLRAAIVRVDGLGFTMTPSRTTPWSYFRFHGRRGDVPASERDLPHARYNYLYAKEEVGELARSIREAYGQDERTLVVFNNHYRGQGPRNAADLLGALGLPMPTLQSSAPKETRLDDFV